VKRTVLLTTLILAACILPDRDINIVNEDIQNKHAVRIVEPIELTEEARLACEEAAKEDDAQAEACPQPGSNPLAHFLDPQIDDYNFCACDAQEAQEEQKKLREVTLYVEDRDETRDHEFDTLYAAIQLDLDPTDPSPHLYVQYEDFVNAAVPLPDDDQLEYSPVKRPDPHLRVLKLGNDVRRIDLCNDVKAIDKPLPRGFHTLRLIVTDRPWFTDEDGKPKPGVPDLASGATYDTLTYIFHCDDKTNKEDEHCLDECVPQGEL
jgi:hypothetical protein